MASPAPVSLPSTVSSRFPIFRGQQWQLYRGSAVCAWNSRTSVTCCVRPPTMALFREPPKIMVHLNNFRERLWEVVPRSVKDFPWKKTEDILLQQSLLVGREALKWLLLLLYVCSSVSDVIYSISRNKELTIPFGLFVGCMVANFLVDTSQELFPISQIFCWAGKKCALAPLSNRWFFGSCKDHAFILQGTRRNVSPACC
ncbi:uncharacterized protein LOC127808378 isoform X2 [Diospyros lotus]|uniref:uncharacterized protein LOC127808378 isoform X2 n=1 Tax=Diospyros lotus TaxID=55363 RepID=UPI00224EA067|nr:uncharacterized protein LOC127808378 isoform X2 [Diospyros lotus]